MEEEIITPEEEIFNYNMMRYDLDEEGYILNVFFGCMSGTCAGYEGTIPEGYETLVEWADNANIRAYKVIDGNLAYDSVRDAQLKGDRRQYIIEHDRLVLSQVNLVRDLAEKGRRVVQTIAFALLDHNKSHVAKCIQIAIDTTFRQMQLFADILYTQRMILSQENHQSQLAIKFFQFHGISCTIKCFERNYSPALTEFFRLIA